MGYVCHGDAGILRASALPVGALSNTGSSRRVISVYACLGCNRHPPNRVRAPMPISQMAPVP
jgi:hypothetical protein